jgi:hypothetical protein
MALPSAPVARTLKHTRTIQVDAYQRDDGLFDLEARLTDTKAYKVDLLSGRELLPGECIHDLSIRVTINERLDVVDVAAVSDAVPNPGVCETIAPAYGQLVGLNLLRSFRREVKSRMGRTSGCTHLSELTSVLPTAALQAFGSIVFRQRENAGPPFFIDQCHAYDRGGEIVREHYPQWFVSRD